MDGPSELSLAEIREFMLLNNCRVTNHSLVKHFKKFLTNPETQSEARKHFKTYVNILATIRNENNEKFLILREKYLNECPSEEALNRSQTPMSPGASSIISEGSDSPLRRPPPYKPPPEVSPTTAKVPVLQQETKENYRECINEFEVAMSKLDSNRNNQTKVQPDRPVGEIVQEGSAPQPTVPPRKRPSGDRSMSREDSVEENKENIRVSSDKDKLEISNNNVSEGENQVNVKEVTRKFNRMASEEEAKVISPSSKKKPDATLTEEILTPSEVEEKSEVTMAHPEARKWIVAAAKADYYELAKLASKHPELVKLQDPTTGYTALHWAAKHGNENVVKLIAGTYKANVNARTNGGYTPLHLAVQFEKDDIFELLCNVYKANRDLTDWSGNKPLDYSKQSTSVSASTYSSEYKIAEVALPAHMRNFNASGTLTLPRKNRLRHRSSTASLFLHRTQSMIFAKDSASTLPSKRWNTKSFRRSQSPRDYDSTSPDPSPTFSEDFSDDMFNFDKNRSKRFWRQKFRPNGKKNAHEVASN